MVKLSITVGANNIQIETDAPFSEVLPVLELWFTAIEPIPPAEADHLVLTVGTPVEQPIS